jgi:CBS domain-containing protein
MDILAFVKPLHEVVYVFDDFPIQEALEKMKQYRFSSIPILSRDGKFVGTLTEGDLLWHFQGLGSFDMKNTKKELVSQIRRHRDYKTINIHSNIDELIIKASDENFVPVVDDQEKFIGIVTRKTLLNYFFEHNFIVL